jgi:hypothetical protein
LHCPYKYRYLKQCQLYYIYHKVSITCKSPTYKVAGAHLPNIVCICNKIFVPTWNLFRRNLFHRKFVLSELFKWKISSWNIFHRKIYSAYVKFVLVSISRPTVKFVSEWTLQKQLLVSLLDKA